MSVPEEFTTDGGQFPRVGRLATVVLGVIAANFFGGLAAVVDGFFQYWMIRPIQGFARWLEALVAGTFGWISFGISIGGRETAGFTVAWGILAFVVGLALVLLLAYMVAWGRGRL